MNASTSASTVKYTLPAFDVDMGGLAVKQALPTQKVDQIDPFLLLHHTQVPVAAGTHPLAAGVPPHPHRGFSAVTVVIGGEVHHRDSLGNSSIIGPGGIQWVQAGRGIVHSERPSAALARAGGSMDVIQLWVNSPSAAKMAPAAYHARTKEELRKVALAEGAVMHLIAGTYEDANAGLPLAALAPPHGDSLFLARMYAEAGAAFVVKRKPGHHTAAYLISGKGHLKGHGLLEAHHLYVFEQGHGPLDFEASEHMDILWLSGEPIKEPVASYGPFVMNTQTEIMQALRDHQMGKMGVLIEEL
jgi:redox-sensitive bicupin YhaK (pirin superfamily)